MKLAIGTEIFWESAAGLLRGTIKNIVLSPAANGEVIPWIDVQYTKRKVPHSERLCASVQGLKMMRVEVVSE